MDREEQHFIPKAADLGHFGNLTELADGILLEDIDERKNLIEVQAEDITLKIAVLNKEESIVGVQADRHFFTTPEICRLAGSTLGGSFVKTKWIGTGFRLELHRLREPLLSKTRVITTSAVQTIIVWDDPEAVKKLMQSV